MVSGKDRFALLTFAVLVGFVVQPIAVPAQEQVAAKTEAPQSKIRELQKERLSVLRTLAQQDTAMAKAGQVPFDQALASNKVLAEAELELCETDEDRVAVLKRLLVIARDQQTLVEQLVKSENATMGVLLRAKAERLRIEIALERATTNSVASVNDHEPNDLLQRSQVILAEKTVALQRSAIEIAVARKEQAQANLAAVKAHADVARSALLFAEKQAQRFKELFQTKTIDDLQLEEQRFKRDSALASRVEAEARIMEAERQVAIEQLQIEKAKLELETVQSKLESLKGDWLKVEKQKLERPDLEFKLNK